MLRAFGQSIQHMPQHHATMLQDVALKCCERLARPLKKHLLARILEQNKQTNQLLLYVQKSAGNCYLIQVENKNSSFISEQRKNRLNHFLKIRIHLK